MCGYSVIRLLPLSFLFDASRALAVCLQNDLSALTRVVYGDPVLEAERRTLQLALEIAQTPNWYETSGALRSEWIRLRASLYRALSPSARRQQPPAPCADHNPPTASTQLTVHLNDVSDVKADVKMAQLLCREREERGLSTATMAATTEPPPIRRVKKRPAHTCCCADAHKSAPPRNKKQYLDIFHNYAKPLGKVTTRNGRSKKVVAQPRVVRGKISGDCARKFKLRIRLFGKVRSSKLANISKT